MVVMMENKNYSQVIGRSSQPYTNSLADRYGLATRSYALGHPSLPNYLELVSGANQGVTDDGPPSSHSFAGVPTLADQLIGAGVKVKAYAENLPADPKQDAGEYAVRHFPWVYFPSTKTPIADASDLMADLNSPDGPDFVWYTPNLINDEHDGTVEQGDAFLARFIPEVQSTAWYKAGGRIIIEWDESDNDNAGLNGSGGGHIPTIVVSEALKSAPQKEAAPVDTAGILASIEDLYGVGHLGGAANAGSGNINALLK
jgi:phosphatidylinositol-3-phosphatase